MTKDQIVVRLFEIAATLEATQPGDVDAQGVAGQLGDVTLALLNMTTEAPSDAPSEAPAGLPPGVPTPGGAWPGPA